MGGFSGVHQFCKVGAHAFIANNCRRDARRAAVRDGRGPAGRAAFGQQPKGLKRRGFSAEQIRNIREAYRMLYRSDLLLADAVEKLSGCSAATQPEIRAVRRIHRARPTRGLIR